jgi:hypothetical protein
MIHDFEDFCLYSFVIIDDIWQKIKTQFARPGPQPTFSDSELITVAVVSECRGWDTETELLDHWHPYRRMFPNLPERTRFNRRRRNLAQAINLIRRILVRTLDLSRDGHCLIDSLPVPVVQFHLVPSSTGDWPAYGADFGKVASKHQTIFGYKLHLLITLNGVILDFELAPASAADVTVAKELLARHTDLTVLGDKGYVSESLAETLRSHHRLHLVALRRKNQKQPLSDFMRKIINRVRQLIETVNGQLTDQFNVGMVQKPEELD